MDLFANLALGFDTAFTLQNLLYCLIGCILGTLIGVLPGLGPIATIAMLLPATYALPPIAALIMLAGIYYGSQYGGSTTAILLNIPGETSSVVTAIDGYQMARNGRAGVALFTAGMGSFFAGCVATLVLAAFAAPLSQLAFKFGPAEYFSLMILGLIGAVVLASGSLIKAIGMIILGLLMGLIGTDVNSGVSRYAFDVPELSDGIGFVAVAMGVFGFAEIMGNLEKQGEDEGFLNKLTSMIPTKTGAAKAVGLVLPALAGRFDGFAMRVPVINVSVVDLTFAASRATSVDEVNTILKAASEGELKGILGFNTLPLVSIDFNHDPRPSIYDASQTRVSADGKLVKVLAWYDNEWGYSVQMLNAAEALMAVK